MKESRENLGEELSITQLRIYEFVHSGGECGRKASEVYDHIYPEGYTSINGVYSQINRIKTRLGNNAIIRELKEREVKYFSRRALIEAQVVRKQKNSLRLTT